ncbi:class I SAM-dependent methyltransferase [Cellulomonas sp. NS3]|uniref:class I SAM-dependent methyltransferase n=1 Tax=Cellulomonas sp. NS3 TaxID=2973977 RepID=UPI002163C0EA|nr:class I SAM-dependent methyltransferase [Cellulomonas sp. NS3]
MPTYDTAVDPAAENNSHALMLRLVGGGKKVLDVGCATGYLGQAFMANGCSVSGVELDPEAAERAAKILDEVVVADLEDVDLVGHFGPGSFDVVVFGDVLEHLRDPERLLRRAVGLLADRGSVVISIPNVAHADLRLSLLQGRWEYSDRGLLDRTHVQFFTRRTLLEMLRRAGLAAVEVRSTVAPPFGTELGVDPAALPDGVVDWVRAQPDADVYQFVVRAVRDDAEAAVDRVVTQLEETREALSDAAAELAAKEAEVARLAAELARSEDARQTADSTLGAVLDSRSMRALRRPKQVYGWVRSRTER